MQILCFELLITVAFIKMFKLTLGSLKS